MSDLLSSLPGIMADVFEQGAISWREVVGRGTFATLDEARLTNRHEVLAFDDLRQAEVTQLQGTLTTPTASQALEVGYEIQEADGTTWAVKERSGLGDAGVRIYQVRRDALVKHTANKGHAT